MNVEDPLKRIAIAHESESEPEFKRQKLEEWKIDHETHVSVAEKIDNSVRVSSSSPNPSNMKVDTNVHSLSSSLFDFSAGK